MGPITQRIERLFEAVVRGQHPGYAFWRTPIYATEPVLTPI
jgi:hypothetical protein